jgi:hypothetical protein
MPSLSSTDLLYGAVLRRLIQLASYTSTLPSKFMITGSPQVDHTIFRSTAIVSQARLAGTSGTLLAMKSPIYGGLATRDEKMQKERLRVLMFFLKRVNYRLTVLQAFHAEMVLTFWLVHPNIIPCIGLHEGEPSYANSNRLIPGTPSLVMEWMHHGDLEEYLNDHSATADRLRLVSPFCLELNHAPGLCPSRQSTWRRDSCICTPWVLFTTISSR